MSSKECLVMGHPTLNQNVRNAALAFANAGVLESFHTTINTTSMTFLPRGRLFDEVKRRSLPKKVSDLTLQHPFLELNRVIGSRYLGKLNLPTPSILKIYQQIDKAVARSFTPLTTKIYGYEDGSKFSFIKAATEGIDTVYDLPTGYWRAKEVIFNRDLELSDTWWGSSKSFATPEEQQQNKDLEVSLASKIIVASQFTANTLELFPHMLPNLLVVPYGSGTSSRNIAPRLNGIRKLEVLYVGAITQRKGLAYLFKAVEPFQNSCNLTLIGMDHAESEILTQNANRHTWHRSLPHAAVLSKMRTCDVLVFPSLFEGFGLVITEALSQGLPVITTTNTAGPDLISHGENGWIVHPHNHEAIQEILESIIRGQANLDDMKESAYLSSQRRNWDHYQKDVSDAVLG